MMMEIAALPQKLCWGRTKGKKKETVGREQPFFLFFVSLFFFVLCVWWMLRGRWWNQ